MRHVADLPHRFLHALQICRMNEEIDIAGLAQRNIAVDGLRQGQTLIGNEVDTSLRQAVRNTNKFT